MSGLLEKSEINKNIISKAEADKNYCLAVSRGYYSIYQKVMHKLNCENIDSYDDAMFDELEQKYDEKIRGSHIRSIYAYTEYCLDINDMEKLIFKSNIKIIKDLRVKADYSPKKINYEEFIDFKTVYEDIEGVIITNE